LIATAIGLFAAIPAVLAFNHYTAKGEAIYSDRALFAEEMVALLQRQSVGSAQEDA
jgi:biopolymer transport protein TolQ